MSSASSWLGTGRPPTQLHLITDLQQSGPFRYWKHVHRMIPQGPDACVLEDRIEYELPLGPLGALAHAAFVARALRRIFDHRARAIAALLGDGATAPAAGP